MFSICHLTRGILRTVERENIKELLITAKPKEQWMKE
jgi:hypothetical protein